MKRQKLVILPRLHDSDGDASKRWFVFYTCKHPLTGRMQRFRVYEGFAELKTKAEKTAHGKGMVARLSRKLKEGWNPFENNKVIYKDELEYYEKAKKSGRIKENKFNFAFYLSEYILNHKDKIRLSSYHTYVSKFRVFKDWLVIKKLDQLDIEAITVDHANEFLRYVYGVKKRSPKTGNEYVRLIRSLMNELLEQGKIKENPFRFIKTSKTNSKPAKYFKSDVLTQFKNAIAVKEPQLWLFSEFIYYTFIRPEELRLMKISDIDFSAASITVRREVSKNKKEQRVIIPMPLLKILRQKGYDKIDPDFYVFSFMGEPGKKELGKNHFGRKFRDIRDNIGLSKDYKLYSFKHTGALNLVKSGANIKEVQMQLRHHSLDQVDAYINQMEPAESEAIRNNFPEI